MRNVLIIGAGGHGKVVADTLIAMDGATQIAFLDDRFPGLSQVSYWPVVGRADQIECYRDQFAEVVVAIGHSETRLDYAQRALASGYQLPVVVHPFSYVSPSAVLGAGTVVFAGAVVQSDVKLGMACIINSGATVDHDSYLGTGVHVSPGANVGGGVEIADCTWIGIGASVREYIKIGSHVIVGAGASVVSEVEDEAVVIGVPARAAPKQTKIR